MSDPEEIQKFEFDKDPAALDDRDLVFSHALLHRYWKVKQETGTVLLGGEPRSNEDLINYHSLILEEMKKRGFLHRNQDELDDQTEELVDSCGDPDEEEIEKSRAPFSSAAGKSRVAKRIVALIPDHRIYIEPFCGSGAVLFTKAPSEIEIISDADPEVAFAMKFIKASTDGIFSELRKFNWIGTRTRFSEVKSLKPKNELERFYRFRYLRLHSFGSNMSSWAPDQDGVEFRGWGKLRSARDRLAKVEIIEGDGVQIMKERSDDDSFAFLDPPYWKTGNNAVEGRRFDPESFRKALSAMKGKWLLTLMSEAREIEAPYRRRIFFRHNSRNWGSGSTQVMRSEMLLANYNAGEIEKSLDPDDVEGLTKAYQEERVKYLQVRPSGKSLGRDISKEEVLEALAADFKIRSPFAYLVGGLAIHGRTAGDIDILIKDDGQSSKLRKVWEWRILRALPSELWPRVQFVYDDFNGPITDHVPLFDLVVSRVNPGNETIRMSLGRDPESFEKQERVVPRSAEADTLRQIRESIREDRVEPFRPFVPQKPVKIGPEIPQTVENFLALFEDGDFPILNSHKYDGARHIISKKGDRVEIWSEDGRDNTARLPAVAEAVRKLKDDSLVLDSEIELWEEGRHRPKEAVMGRINAKGDPDPAGILAEVFDLLYLNGEDIHKRPQAERLDLLAGLGFPQSEDLPNPALGLNLVRHYPATDRKALELSTQRLSAEPGSEGVVAKRVGGRYYLDGDSRGAWVKYHKAATLIGIITARKETEGGAWVYSYKVQSDEAHEPTSETRIEEGEKIFALVGDSFSTGREAKVGDRIEIEYEQLNLTRHDPEGTWEITAWAPRVLAAGPWDGDPVPSRISDLERKARSLGILQLKVVSDGETIYKATDPFMEIPEESSAGYKYVVQHHYRGETVHSDIRAEGPGRDFLIGWTLADMVPDSFSGSIDDEARKRLGLDPGEPVPEDDRQAWIDSMLKIAKERDKERGAFKIDWSTGEFSQRKTRSGNIVPAELRAFQKSREPLAWLDVEGVTPPFPAPGATRQFRGIFSIVDGTPETAAARMEYGRQAPYFHEYYFRGGKLRGRLVFRQLSRESLAESSKGLLTGTIEDPELGLVKARILPAGIPDEGETSDVLWVAIQPIDQTPYFLSRRSVDQKHYPPAGTSGLPWEVRQAIPAAFRYWDENDQRKAREMRDSLIAAIAAGDVPLDFDRLVAGREGSVRKTDRGRFSFIHAWFRGPKVVREGPTAEHFDLMIDAGSGSGLERWVMSESMIDNPEVSAIMKADRDKSGFSFEGEAEPGSPYNPTKATPAFVERLDEGPILVLEDGDLVKKWRLEGKELRGLWLAERSGPADQIWTIRRTEDVSAS